MFNFHFYILFFIFAIMLNLIIPTKKHLCDKDVLQTYNTWLLILHFHIFAINSNLLIPTKKNYLPWPLLCSHILVRTSEEGSHKNCHHSSNDNRFSCLSWWQFLWLAILPVTDVPMGAPPPSKNAGWFVSGGEEMAFQPISFAIVPYHDHTEN